MGFLLPDALAVKHSLGQSCRVVPGPSLDPDGWKRRRAKANENSLANVISLDEVRDEIEMHGSLGRTMDEVREDIADAYAEEDEMDEAEAEEELADGYEAYALLTEEYEAEKLRALKAQQMAAASVQAATRGKRVRDDIKGQHTAAASMQAATRGKQQRDELKGQHTAAASMQAATRGKQQRDEIKQADQFEEDMRAMQGQRKAAAAVQAATRGKQARDRMQ